MKKLVSVTAIVAAIVSTSAFAQTSSAAFSGVDLGLGINQSSNTVKAGLSVVDVGGGSLDGVGKTSTNGVIAANYFFPLSPNWLLGIGGTYTLGNQKAGDANINGSSGMGASGSLRYKNAWSIPVTIGYALDQRVMLYGKISYNAMKGEASGSFDDGSTVSSGSVSENFRGWGYGVGTRVNLSKCVFIDGSVEQIDYRSKSFSVGGGDVLSIKPTSLSGKIVVGYRF